MTFDALWRANLAQEQRRTDTPKGQGMPGTQTVVVKGRRRSMRRKQRSCRWCCLERSRKTNFQAEKPLPAATFHGEAQFLNTQVENFVSFGGGREMGRGTIFAAKATFSGAKFSGVSNFQGVEFKGDAEFADT
jgi:hypothetical protein